MRGLARTKLPGESGETEPGSQALIVFCGLPGTGKSTLACALADRYGLPLFNKDRVRAALFGPRHVLHEREQDDCVVECMLQAIAWSLARKLAPCYLLDGRTWLQAGERERLCDFVQHFSVQLFSVHCACSPAQAHARLLADQERALHPARNRTPQLYDRLAANQSPWPSYNHEYDSGRQSPTEGLRGLEQALQRAGIRLPATTSFMGD